MDPVGAFIIAAFVLIGGVRGWWQGIRARMSGDTEALEARRAQERQQAHDWRVQREQHRHAEHMAGQGYPSFGQSVGAGFGRRLADGPLPYDRRHPLRRWWWDRCEDWADRDELRRHEYDRRTANGEQWWQKMRDRASRRAATYWENTQARREEKRRQAGIPDAEWWETTDEPVTPADPADGPPAGPTPQPPKVDTPPQGTPRQEPGRPEPVQATAERINHPTGQPPGTEPLELEPGWPAWGATDQTTENPPATVYAIAERIPELPDGYPAGISINQGVSMSEIVSPETAKRDAEFLSTEMTSLVAHLDARIGEMTQRDIEGVEDYQRMRDAVAGVVPVADEVAETFTGHLAKQDALHAGGKPGDGSYMGLNS